MKKYSCWVFVLLFGFSQAAQAQVLDQGNFLLGATIGFSRADSKISVSTDDVVSEEAGHEASQFGMAPKIGYFLLENFTLGIGMDYTFSTVKEPNEDRTDDSDLLFGPFARYYMPLGDDLAVFGEANFGFGNSKDEQLAGSETQRVNTNVFAIGVGPGFTIFSSKDIGIEALFKYNFARSSFDTDLNGVKTSRTTQTHRFDISLGLQFYFGGIRKVGN